MVRHRNVHDEKKSLKKLQLSHLSNIEDDKYKQNKKSNLVSWWWMLILTIFILCLSYVANQCHELLPAVVTINESEKNPYLFSGERSREILRKFTNLGPRVVGSNINEVDSPKIIEDEVEKIVANSHSSQSILIQRQIGSGGYQLDFNPPFSNIYMNIQNVIVMVEGIENSHSILVNCHYDSVPTSYGASDDAIACSTMLEIIRVLSLSPTRFKHNIVFLFNGAEEVPLQASHLFLKHQWASKCHVFLNLEAAGAGGKEVLFQSGPFNSWLLNYYVKNAPHPFGQVIGEELFQSGVIPSDTDFRVFRDFGNMPGLDFAFWQNGYVYHTKYDAEEYIPLGSYQNIGDNVLALLRALGNAPELDNMNVESDEKMVYYDYLGLFMVSYTATTNIILNIAAIVLSTFSILFFDGFKINWQNIREILLRSFGNIVCMVSTLITAAAVGFMVDLLAPFAIPWYSSPLLIIPLYWCSSLSVLIITVYAFNNWRLKKSRMVHKKSVQIDMASAQIFFLVLLIISTIAGLRSSSLFFLPVMSSAIASLLINCTSLKNIAHKWISLYLVFHIPSLIYNLYMVSMCYKMFMPIFGRSGPINADLIIGILTALFIFLIINFMIPLITIVRRPWIMAILFAMFSVVTIIMVVSGNLGHPYNVSLSIPRPQRYLIMHSSREFRDESQTLRRNETGYVVLNLDRNSPRTVPIDQRHIKSLKDDCDNELYCGIPLYTSRILMISEKSNWIPAGKPQQPYETELELGGGKPICQMSTSVCQLSFKIKGPDRMALTFAPRDGATLINWSLPTAILPTGSWRERHTYFIHIVKGNMKGSFDITFTFNVSSQQVSGSPILDIGVSGNHIHHEDMISEEFRKFTAAFPKWTHVIKWISAYKAYVF